LGVIFENLKIRQERLAQILLGLFVLKIRTAFSDLYKEAKIFWETGKALLLIRRCKKSILQSNDLAYQSLTFWKRHFLLHNKVKLF
jgi:hypothetical protein